MFVHNQCSCNRHFTFRDHFSVTQEGQVSAPEFEAGFCDFCSLR